MHALLSRVFRKVPNTVVLPASYTVVGCACAVVFLTAGIVMTFYDARPWIFPIHAGLAALGAAEAVCSRIAKITYGDNSFTYRNAFGRSAAVPYADVETLDRTGSAPYDTAFIVTKAKKRYSVALNAPGADEFLETVSARIR